MHPQKEIRHTDDRKVSGALFRIIEYRFLGEDVVLHDIREHFCKSGGTRFQPNNMVVIGGKNHIGDPISRPLSAAMITNHPPGAVEIPQS